MEHSREEKKHEVPMGKKRMSQATKQVTPLASKKTSLKADTSLGAASKTAKQKLKNMQSKKSNQRLAKLEKMYQELTEIEAKNNSQL